MRSYRQYCSFARGLDIVGDRWILLIVRELMQGPRRYNELLHGLPGIATNLLAERLEDLVEAGVLERGPEHTYALTEWGEGLREVVYAVGRWARPMMGQMKRDDEFRSHWLIHPIHVLYEGVDRRRPGLVVGIDTADAPMTLESANGRVRVVPGRHPSPDVILSGPPDGIIGVLAGKHDRAAVAKVTVKGDVRKIAKLRPHAV
ncbi:MAG: helix-turn-helix transcriptional regulator [Chloroflexota bacterium]|nr:helix-turn-helix transcriptional regulator [Chloroflexota bacterium]